MQNISKDFPDQVGQIANNTGTPIQTNLLGPIIKPPGFTGPVVPSTFSIFQTNSPTGTNIIYSVDNSGTKINTRIHNEPIG